MLCSLSYSRYISKVPTGCTEDYRWTGAGLDDNQTRVEMFEATMLRYMRENVAVVNMFLKQPYCELFMQERDKTWISFVSDLGGILGLCLGISIVSLLEILWYCLMLCYSVLESSFTFMRMK